MEAIKEMALAQLNVVRESLINKFEDEDDVGDVQDSSDDDTGTDGTAWSAEMNCSFRSSMCVAVSYRVFFFLQK